MHKITKLILFLLLNTSILSAQNNFFKTAENEQLFKKKEVLSNIKKNRVYSLDEKAMRSYLRTAPVEFKNNGATIPLDIPLPDGTVETFNMVESPLLSPEVAAANPSIKTYIGTGTKDKKASISLSLTSAGFNAIILNVGNETVYFDSYSNEKNNIYFNYFIKDVEVPVGEKSKSCLVEPGDEVQIDDLKKKERNPLDAINKISSSSGTQLRTFRLAVAANGEFTRQYGSTTKAGGLAAVVAYVNRIRLVFRKELAVDFVLVSGENLIYTDPATDPFTDALPLDPIHSTINTVLGNGNASVGNSLYDIGHLFGFVSGSGNGLAGSRVCEASSKGRAYSLIGSVNSYSQDFMDNLILHEMGHQFAMSHSFNSTVNVCTSRNAATSVEPGSGATIMSYGFICGTDNAAGTPYNALLQYHSVNYEQAIAFINTKTCQVTTATGNTAPVITVPAGYTIPKSTPFILTGSATDVNSTDVLTYCWEGTDIGTVVPDATTLDDTAQPPFFRSYAPSTSPSRTYPSLEYILNGTNQDKGDKLPSIGIVTRHSFTVRDNNAAGGGVNNANVNVTIDGNIGPFLETTNLSGIHAASSTKTITWSVNGTNIATPLIKISLSTDGGFTWPITLASATPNDGSQSVTLPNLSTTLARIKIEAIDNVFFDISNVNFTIEQPLTANVSGTNTLSGTSTGSATAATFGGKLTSSPIALTRSFTISNFNIDNTPVTYGSISFPALPAGATINSAALNITTVRPISPSWASDVLASLTGAYTLGYTQITTVSNLTAALATVNLPNFITTGGSINLLMYDNYSDNTGVEATFASARIDVNYIRNGYTYLWSTGATTPTITGLAAGTYTVTVTDASGATATGSYIVQSEFTVVATAGSNGTISPSGTSRVVSGGSITYTITPNDCFRVSSVAVDGGHRNTQTSFFFPSITANRTIHATFASTSTTNTTNVTSCGDYTWPDNNQVYTASGTYTGTTTNCVTQRLNLTITPSSFQTTTISACDSYVWNGTTYTSTGIYTGTTTNCVTQRLNLTITPSSFQTTAITACDSYVWNGTTYTSTGIYTGTTTNCVTQRLNLTITPSSVNTTTIIACDSYVWNGTTYTTTGIYTGTTTNCVTERLNLTINRTTWNGASWSNGVPDINTKAIISGNYSQAANVSACSLDITGTSVVTVPTGFNFNISGKVTVAPTASLTFANNTNLIQMEHVGNSGIITINRNSNPLRRLDFTIWSSPVTNANQFLTTFSPLTTTTRFYSYNESTNLYNVISNPTSTAFDLAKGYLIRIPNTHPDTPTIWAGSFTGIPNNGTISKPVTYSGSTLFGYNLVGNPYPSSISAEAFVTANASQIEGSLYFWRKVNAAAGTAYAVYTKAGSTKTVSSDIPNGIIQVGQGFFVKAKSGAGTITFNNAMRVADNNNQFFKSEKTTKDRFWLNLNSTAGAFSQMLIGYFSEATTGVDAFDAKYINDSPIALTSSIDNQEYSIQGRPMFNPSDIVALSFKTDVVSEYTISIGNLEGVFEKQVDIYLVDGKTGIETNLKQNSYTFSSTAQVDNTRFSLKYQRLLDIGKHEFNENSVQIYKNNGLLYVNSEFINIANIKVYDVLGRLIIEKKNCASTKVIIKDLKSVNQVLIVKVTGENKIAVTKMVLN